MAILWGAVMLVMPMTAQEPVRQMVDDFEHGDLGRWQSSMSPEYYKGEEGQQGLRIVEDAERGGKVLRANVKWVDPRGSEPCFITRMFDEGPEKSRVVGVSFWYRLSQAALAPEGGFKVRLRTSPSSFTDYDVPEPAAGKWTQATLETKIGPNVRNIYGKLWGRIIQLTFRLDDVDDQNADFDLFVDDIEFLVGEPEEATYEPKSHARPEDDRARVQFMKHSAAGYYRVEEALRAVEPGAEIGTHLFRGQHFEFFDFPKTLEEVLRTDLFIMLDVDPWVLTWEQACWTADTVNSGATLVFLGGPNTLYHAKGMKAPIRSLLPVTWEAGAKDTGGGAPAPAAEHFLTAGFTPEGLGAVQHMHDIRPAEGAQTLWRVGERPLVVAGEVGKGRTLLINAWPRQGNERRGCFLTSDLSDDFLRQVFRWALGRQPEAYLRQVKLAPPTVVGSREVSVEAEAAGADEGASVRLVVAGKPAAGMSFEVSAGAEAERVVPYAIELVRDGEVLDRRDAAVHALNPLGAEIAWACHKRALAPGWPLEFEVSLSRRDLPDVNVSGANVQMTFGTAGGLEARPTASVSIGGFVDTWIHEQATEKVIHDQLGPLDVKVEATPRGWLPAWKASGVCQAARTSGEKWADDPRYMRAERTVEVQDDGSVVVTTEYELLRDVKVSHLPLLINLDCARYAGAAFTCEQAEGVREGTLPEEQAKKLFDGTGMKFTVETPGGPLTIECLDASLRCWLRDLRQYDMDSFRFEIEAPCEGQEVKAGYRYSIPIRFSGPKAEGVAQLSPEQMWVEAAITPADGDEALWQARREAAPTVEFEDKLPNLHPGEYRLSADVTFGSGGRALVRTTAPLQVVEAWDRDSFYPIMTIIGDNGGGHGLDDGGLRARLDDIRAHGFNTVGSIGGIPGWTGGGGFARDRAAAAEAYAQSLGMALIGEYQHYTNLAREGNVKPCVHDPSYRAALEEHTARYLQVGKYMPRLVSIKIVDEPTVTPKAMDYCEHCRRVFAERYGGELKPPDQLVDDPFGRWKLANFLGDHVADAYKVGMDIKQESGAQWDLLVTYMATGLGYQRPLSYQQDALDWMRQADRADFDVYPYWYPTSQKIRMLQAAYAMASMRDYARHLGKPWGFYFELDDRNWPYQQNPKQASAECAYTAVCHGAGYLNSFIHNVSGAGTDSRPERWEHLGGELPRIRRIGPMLVRLPRARSTVAHFFPDSQQYVNNGYTAPTYAWHCVNHGWGMMDVYHEEVARKDGLDAYGGLLVLGTELMHADMIPAVDDWVRAGGVLIYDTPLAQNHRGEAVEAPWERDAAEARSLPGIQEATYSTWPHGEGRVVFWGFDADALYKDFVENDQPKRAGALRKALAEVLEGAGLQPPASVRDPRGQMEIGLRATGDTAVVIVVNHDPEENTGQVSVRGLPFRPGLACDLRTMQPAEVEFTDDGATFSVTLGNRASTMIALYPGRPQAAQVTIKPERVKRDSELTCEVELPGQEGCHLVEVKVADAQGRPLPWLARSVATEGGRARFTLPAAANEPTGEHVVTASIPAAGLTASATFVVD